MAEQIMDRVYEFRMVGEVDCLMHRDDVEAADGLEFVRKNMKKDESKAGDDRSPPWTWTTYLYNDGKVVACPFENVMRSLRYGGARVTLKGSKTFKEITQSAIVPMSPFFEFRYGGRLLTMEEIKGCKDLPFNAMKEKVQKQLGFDLHVKRAQVGPKKHVRVRPRFASWVIKGRLSVTDKALTDEVLGKILSEAGKGGMFDWRPSSPKSPGFWGRYQGELKRVE